MGCARAHVGGLGRAAAAAAAGERGCAMAVLPAVLDDAVFRRVREERPALAAAVEAATAGPQQLMVRSPRIAHVVAPPPAACVLSRLLQDYLVLAGTAGSPATLQQVQELADKLAQEQGARAPRKG